MAKKNKRRVEKKKLSPQEVKANIIIAVIIVAVLALAVIATLPTIKENMAENAAQNVETQAQSIETIGQVAETLGLSVDEFMTTYGINAEGANADTNMQDIIATLTVENYVNLINAVEGSETTFNEFVEQNGIPLEKLTPETTIEEAMNFIPISYYLSTVELDTDFATLKAEAGLGDDVTEETSWNSVAEQLAPVVQNHIVQATAAPAEEAPAEEAVAE